MDVLEFTTFSWALEINMLECQGIRVQNPTCSRAKGLNMLEFKASSWVLELIMLEFATLSQIERVKTMTFTTFSWVVELNMLEFPTSSWALEIKMLEFSAFLWALVLGRRRKATHCKALAHFCTDCPPHWTPRRAHARSKHDLANWRSYSKMERFGGPKHVILGFFALRFLRKIRSTFVRTMVCWHVWLCEVFFAFSAQDLGMWAWHPAPENVKILKVPKPTWFLSETIARNGFKSRFFLPKSAPFRLFSCGNANFCQIVPVSCTYPHNGDRHLLEESGSLHNNHNSLPDNYLRVIKRVIITRLFEKIAWNIFDMRVMVLVTTAGRFATRFAQIDSRESFAVETPIFIMRQADSPESLEFPIRVNHPIRANRANRFARIMPLSSLLFEWGIRLFKEHGEFGLFKEHGEF